MDIATDIDRTRKESFFQTPLWYLEDSRWRWLKESSPAILKRSLCSPKTLFGIGKIIEMSIYPEITAIYSLQLPSSHEDVSQWDLEQYVNKDITEIQSFGERIMLLPQDRISPTPEELEVHLRSFYNLYIGILGHQKALLELDLNEGELLSYTENLTFEKGIQIEALSH